MATVLGIYLIYFSSFEKRQKDCPGCCQQGTLAQLSVVSVGPGQREDSSGFAVVFSG